MKRPSYVAYWPGTPGGHVCFLADEALKAKRSDVQLNMAAAKSRQTALARGNSGTIKGLSANGDANARDVSKAMLPARKVKVPA